MKKKLVRYGCCETVAKGATVSYLLTTDDDYHTNRFSKPRTDNETNDDCYCPIKEV